MDKKLTEKYMSSSELKAQERNLKYMNTHMNSKLDIFQDIDNYVYRNGFLITQPFLESYEHIGLQNQSAKLLSSASNLLLYGDSKRITNDQRSKFEIKRMFTKSELKQNENKTITVLKGCEEYLKKITETKYRDNEAFKKLDAFISNPRFSEFMIYDKAFLKFILDHPMLVYHPKYEEINNTYRKYLCPMYNNIGPRNSNNSNTNNAEPQNVDEDDADEMYEDV